MNNSDRALSFEQARNFLPDEFRSNAELTGRKKLFNTLLGLRAYHYSSSLKDRLWQTSHSLSELALIFISLKNFHYLYKKSDMDKKPTNRIKVMLAERKKTNLWLAAELGVNSSTVSKW